MRAGLQGAFREGTLYRISYHKSNHIGRAVGEPVFETHVRGLDTGAIIQVADYWAARVLPLTFGLIHYARVLRKEDS